MLKCQRTYVYSPTHVCALDFSPIKGPEGNIEFLLYVQHSESPQMLPQGRIEEVVRSAHEALDKAPNLH